MAELATVARPYAEALFGIAQSGDLAAWSERLAELAEAASQPELLSLSTNPKVTHAEVSKLIGSVMKHAPDAATTNFIDMLVGAHRLSLLPEIAAQFEQLKNAHDGAAEARITSAFPLEGEALDQLVAALDKKFGRKLRPSVTVDASLIGGVRVVVGDEVLDASVSARLDRMRTTLTA